MKKPLHAVDHFFKRRLLDSFKKPESSKIVDQVRREMRGIKVDHRPVAEVVYCEA